MKTIITAILFAISLLSLNASAQTIMSNEEFVTKHANTGYQSTHLSMDQILDGIQPDSVSLFRIINTLKQKGYKAAPEVSCYNMIVIRSNDSAFYCPYIENGKNDFKKNAVTIKWNDKISTTDKNLRFFVFKELK
jgi:hypothetical protein